VILLRLREGSDSGQGLRLMPETVFGKSPRNVNWLTHGRPKLA
jgi:hypothetical protein